MLTDACLDGEKLAIHTESHSHDLILRLRALVHDWGNKFKNFIPQVWNDLFFFFILLFLPFIIEKMFFFLISYYMALSCYTILQGKVVILMHMKNYILFQYWVLLLWLKYLKDLVDELWYLNLINCAKSGKWRLEKLIGSPINNEMIGRTFSCVKMLFLRWWDWWQSGTTSRTGNEENVPQGKWYKVKLLIRKCLSCWREGPVQGW